MKNKFEVFNIDVVALYLKAIDRLTQENEMLKYQLAIEKKYAQDILICSEKLQTQLKIANDINLWIVDNIFMCDFDPALVNEPKQLEIQNAFSASVFKKS
jgi:hypothetical protein